MFRSYLFTPGDSEKKIDKALSSDADCVILDLEDSVWSACKDRARNMVHSFLRDTGARGDGEFPKIYVRVNGMESRHFHADIAMLSGSGADGVLLPKCESFSSLSLFDSALAKISFTNKEDDSRLSVIAIATESAHSVFGLGSYGEARRRDDIYFSHIDFFGLAWGCEDLSTDIGAQGNRNSDGIPCAPYRLVRHLCLFAAHSAYVEAIDGIYPSFKDLLGLERECSTSAYDGFTGKLAIHPAQIAVINACFTPNSAQIRAASDIVDAFSNNGDDMGVIALDGRMLDRPHLLRARRLLARHRYFSSQPDPGKEGER